MKRPEIIADLQKLYNGERSASGWAGDAGEKTVRHFSKLLKISEEQILNGIAIDTANGFLSGELSWDFGAWVANTCLFSGFSDLGLEEATQDGLALWWEVYLAFDRSLTVHEDQIEAVANEELRELLSRRSSKV